MAYQLDFFAPIPDEIDLLKSQYIDLFNRSENVRKGCFKKINDLGKEVIKIREQNDEIERRLHRVESHLFPRNTEFSLSVEALIGMRTK
jgi:hypothetical protein